MPNPVRLLLDVFPGSTVTTTMHPLISRTPVELARDRGLVTRQVVNCEVCELCSTMPKHPVPFYGPSTWGIMGEGPGSTESRQLRPFVGASGKLLRSMLSHVGLDMSTAQVFNTVSCFPKVGEGKGVKARQPTKEEVYACRKNLVAQTLLLSQPFILLVGGTALRSVRSDLRVTDTHGRIFAWHVEEAYTSEKRPLPLGSFFVMPIYHPASILRTPSLKDSTLHDLQLWADLIAGREQPTFLDRCLNCGNQADNYDPDGIAYCGRHWGRYGGNWVKAREVFRVAKAKRKKGDPIDGQSSLL